MPRAHAEFWRAKKELSSIFAKLKYTSSYATAQMFADALTAWEEKYTNPSQIAKLTDLQKIKVIGVIMHSITTVTIIRSHHL
jgi:hypothetical protein